MLKVIGLSMLGAVVLTPSTVSALELTQWETYKSGEEEEARKMADELINQIKTDYVDKGKRAFRDAHPRGIGCVNATFTVNPALPAKYQTGVFQQPGKSYESIIRFSSSLGPASDAAKDARGFAIKLFGVKGPKLTEGQTNAVTHDFLHINYPTFPARDSHEFAGLVSIKTNPANVVKFLLEAPILRARELKALIDTTQGNPYLGKSLLAMQFFSETPYLLKGAEVNTPVKFTVRPCGAIPDRALDGSEGELRNDLQARLKEGEGCFEFAMQMYKEGFLVEDGMNEWKEEKSPFIKFATIKIPKQEFLTDEKLHYCDKLSFHPWHALDQHRPLGNLNRTRKIVYETISRFRHEANQESSYYDEPKDLSQWNKLKNSAYTDWQGLTVPQNHGR